MQKKVICSKPPWLFLLAFSCFFIWTALARAQIVFSYTTNNGAITILRYIGNEGSVTVPDVINGYPVTALADYAFQPGFSLSSVAIGTNLSSIGNYVFSSCPALFSFTVNSQNAFFSSVNGALFNKNGSTLLVWPPQTSPFSTIPTNVTSIGTDAFDGGKFSSITLPNGLTNIGSSAFQGAANLASITIPGNVKSIGGNVFMNCTSLTNISVVSSNLYFSSTNGILFDKTGQTLIAYPEKLSGATYSIPNSVTTIVSNAMYYCLNLTNIFVSSNVASIGDGAFFDCANLKTITVDPQNGFYYSSNGVLFDKAFTTLLAFPGGVGGNYVVPNNITAIGNYAFEFCTALASLALPDNLTNIGNYAFFYCRALTNVTLGSHLITIEDNAFRFCSGLTNIVIPNTVATIGNYSFYVCSSLANVIIPDSVSVIGTLAFGDCSKLTNVTLGSGLITISNSAFYSCSSLTSIVIPGTVANLGSYVFESCSALTNVNFLGAPPAADSTVFYFSGAKAVYYLPGASGWGPTFGGVPAALWLPAILTNPNQAPFGVQNNQFGFTVSWAANQTIVVQASTNLLNPGWTPIVTNLLTNGVWQFSDPNWTNYPGRFYRVSWH